MKITSDRPAPNAALVALPAFNDNYIWMIRQGNDAVVVDPGQARPVLDAIKRDGLRLRAILLTHHHQDHVGGVTELVDATGAAVHGPADECLPHCDVRLHEGDRIELDSPTLHLTVLDVPGHTAGHIAYHGKAADQAALFCGDTLFAAGCGRVFEGTPAQMYQSLQKFSDLADTTQVCCAHEYTLANLRWALAVEPDNRALQTWQNQAIALRAADQPTVPTTLGLERAVNPFLRTGHPDVAQAAARYADRDPTSPADVFAILRTWKNNFK